jgi:hypothetical protein
MDRPKARVEHLLERRVRLLRRGAREVHVVQAVDELVLRELVDVLLKREVDERAVVVDEALASDGAHHLALHPLAQPGLDVRVLEVEEVARVVPDEAVLLHGLAVAADLLVALQDEDVLLAGERGHRQAADAGADDEMSNGLHGFAEASTRLDLLGHLRPRVTTLPPVGRLRSSNRDRPPGAPGPQHRGRGASCRRHGSRAAHRHQARVLTTSPASSSALRPTERPPHAPASPRAPGPEREANALGRKGGSSWLRVVSMLQAPAASAPDELRVGSAWMARRSRSGSRRVS